MTEMIEIVRLREQIAHQLYCLVLNVSGDEDLFNLMGFATKEKYGELADQILALTKPDGTKAIGVIVDEQDFPECDQDRYDSEYYYEGWRRAGDSAEKAGWVKVIGELK